MLNLHLTFRNFRFESRPSLVAVVHLVVHGVDGERGLGRRRLAANIALIRLVVGGRVPRDYCRRPDESALLALEVLPLGVHEQDVAPLCVAEVEGKEGN